MDEICDEILIDAKIGRGKIGARQHQCVRCWPPAGRARTGEPSPPPLLTLLTPSCCGGERALGSDDDDGDDYNYDYDHGDDHDDDHDHAHHADDDHDHHDGCEDSNNNPHTNYEDCDNDNVEHNDYDDGDERWWKVVMMTIFLNGGQCGADAKNSTEISAFVRLQLLARPRSFISKMRVKMKMK